MGTSKFSMIYKDNTRIIPTRVGTSGFYVSVINIWQDHPHACGDKRITPPFVSLSIGSSPRVWGQESVKLDTAVDAGIIPTRVGTSSACLLSCL